MTYQPRLKGLYKEKVVPALMAEFGYKNQMMVLIFSISSLFPF